MESAVKRMTMNLRAVIHQIIITKIPSFAHKINNTIKLKIYKIINKSLEAVKYLNSVLTFVNNATCCNKAQKLTS